MEGSSNTRPQGRLLIEPFGIETRGYNPEADLGVELLIEPFGIET